MIGSHSSEADVKDRPEVAAATIALVMPNYNHSSFLPATLKSLLRQTRPADEIIVVDDASTDDSVRIMETFACDEPRLRVLRNEARMGVAQATNRALAAARADYVMLASADDELRETAVEKLLALLERYPQAGVCISEYVERHMPDDVLVRHGGSRELGFWYLEGGSPGYVSPERLKELLRRGFVWLHPNAAMFRRAALAEVGGYDPALRWHSDWFATYAVALKYGFCALPLELAVVRRDEGSYSAVGMRRRREQHRVARAIVKKLHEPRFGYFRQAARSRPAMLSTFMRPMLETLLFRPGEWGFLAPILVWWLGQVCRGRRPGFLRDLLRKESV